MLKWLGFFSLVVGLVFLTYPNPFAQEVQPTYFFGGYRIVEGGEGTLTLGGVIPNSISETGALSRLHTIAYCDVGQVEMAAVEEAMLWPVSSIFTLGFFGGGTFWLEDEMTPEENTVWYLMGSTGGFGSAKLNEKLGIWAATKWVAQITDDQPDGSWVFGVGAYLKL